MNTGRRWKDYGQRSPGPGAYNETGNISSGRQVCSNFHSTITKNFKTSEGRTQWGGNPRFRTPAPGTYRPPSDFGYLEFKNQLRDNLNGSVMTGFDTSTANLVLGKMESHAASIHSGKRRNVSDSLKNLIRHRFSL